MIKSLNKIPTEDRERARNRLLRFYYKKLIRTILIAGSGFSP